MDCAENPNMSLSYSTETFTESSLFGQVNGTPTNIVSPSLLDVYLGYIYFVLTAVTSVLSIIGCIIIILSYILIKDLRSMGRQLLIYLSLADLLTACGNFTGITWYIFRDRMTHDVDWHICQAHAYLTIFSSIASFLWTICIGVHLNISIVLGKNDFANSCIWAFHVICWSLPVGVTAAAIVENVVGHDETLPFPSWCWIDPTRDDVLAWQYASGKGWEIACYVITVILYISVKCHLIKQMAKTKNMRTFVGTSSLQTSGNRNVIRTTNQKLTFVPLVFILSRLWGTLRFLIGAHVHAAAKTPATAWIVPLQGVGDSVQGFANCMIFCLTNPKVRESIGNAICKKKKKALRSDIVTHDTSSGVYHTNQAFDSIG